MKRIKRIAFAVTLFCLGLTAGLMLGKFPFGLAPNLRIAYGLIKTSHALETPDDAALYHGAVRGMVEALGDRFSSYMDPKQTAKMNERMSGNFVGVGMEVGVDDGKFTVHKPLAGSPAAQAGIKSGDRITAVDGMPTDGVAVDDSVARIRGKAGTAVTITVEREGQPARDVRLTRAKIATPSVTWSPTPRDGKTVMVITVSEFHDDTADLFDKAVAATLAIRADGVVLDLRNDPGGRLDAAGHIVCTWARPGDAFIVIARRGAKEEPLPCKDVADVFTDMPTAVLINGHSASASEVTAGALQDFGKARLFGETSFGKGCGQTVYPLPDGAELDLVTFLWKTPKGRAIHKIGITPDETVAGDAKEIKNGNDVQMARALEWLSAGR